MADSEKYLIDASVLIAAYIEHHPGALSIITQAFPPFILDLTLAEVANALIHLQVKPQTIINLNSKLCDPPFSYIHTDYIDSENAILIAHKHKATVYDSLYHAAALRRGITFATLDNKYYRSTKKLGSILLVK